VYNPLLGSTTNRTPNSSFGTIHIFWVFGNDIRGGGSSVDCRGVIVNDSTEIVVVDGTVADAADCGGLGVGGVYGSFVDLDWYHVVSICNG
jgi:hypothetical protein